MSARWLTPADIARRLQISRSSAFALVHKLPRYQEGRITRVSEEDFAAYLAANMIAPGEVDARTLERRRQASIAVLAYHERQRAEAAAKAKRKADARAAAALVTKPSGSQLSASTKEPPPIRLTRQPRKLPFFLPPGPPPIDYAADPAEYEAAQRAALRRLEATPAAQLTGKERNELRRVLTYAQQVQHGLRKECAWVVEARRRKNVPALPSGPDVLRPTRPRIRKPL